MTIKEILEIENANTGSINLCKEGLFWRAYNQSAMRLVNNLKPLKIIRKYIKKAGQEIFYCGFPESGLDNIRGKAIEKGFQITETNDKKIIISGVSATEDYKNWMGNQPACLNEPVVQYTKRNTPDNIIQQIQQYPLENATPLETMLFIQKLKQSIKDGIIL